MKISSSIGVTGGQQTTMAATFAEVVASLGYDYTWAWDMATVTASDGYTGAESYTTTTPQYSGTNGTGFRVASSASTGTGLGFSDAVIDNGTHSGGTGGVPDDSIPEGYSSSPGSSYSGEADHGGRYISWVITLDEFTVPSGTTVPSICSNIIATTGGGNLLLLPTFPTVASPGNVQKYINGVAIDTSSWGTQANWNSLLGNISTITYDLQDGWYSNVTDDPTMLSLYPLYTQHSGMGGTVNMPYDMTIHGIILSATPPNITSLPVHTSSPSI